MNVYMALFLFSLIILIYWVITELFTILFRFTGLPDERARFQVISLLTGCGYTTRESEMFLSNRRRRRLARITMLFGYVFNITIVSAFVNVFLSLKMSQVEHITGGILIPLAMVVHGAYVGRKYALGVVIHRHGGIGPPQEGLGQVGAVVQLTPDLDICPVGI